MMVPFDKLTKIALILVLIGGINYFFMALGINIIGSIPLIGRIIYLVIGIAAGYLIYDGWKMKTLW